MKRLLIVLGVVMLAGGVSAQSKDDPSIGSWKLNVAKSKFTPGPPIKADTRSYEAQDGWLIVTTETTQPSGEKTGVRFAARFDGKEYPQIGRFAPTVALISYQPVDKRTLKYTVKDDGGEGHVHQYANRFRGRQDDDDRTEEYGRERPPGAERRLVRKTVKRTLRCERGLSRCDPGN